MAEVKWTAPTAAFNIAGAALNNLGVNQAIEMPVQIDNTSLRHLYIIFRLTLGSLTPANNSYITLRVLRDVGGALPDRSATVFSGGLQFIIPLIPALGARQYETDRLLLPGPFLFTVEIINGAGVSLAGAGNALNYQTFSEEV